MPDVSRPPAVPASVARVFDRALADDCDRPALVTRTRRLSYAELDRLCDRAAHAWLALGAGPGDRVSCALPNEADIVPAFHGAMRIGAVWVGINRALAPPEKAYLLNDSGASLLLCDDATAEQVAAVDVPGLRRTVTTAAGGSGGSGDGDTGGNEWHAALDAAPDGPAGIDIDPLAPAAIAYTSGTTGYPKGAVHSQHNLLVPGAVAVATRGYGPELRKGDCLPLTILNLVVLSTLLVAQAGGCTILMDRIDPEGVAEWIRKEGVTTWNGPPALLHGLVNNAAVAPADLASLDEVWTGGGDCPESLREAFQAKFDRPVLATYGQSEAPTLVTIDPRDGNHVPGASGWKLPHLDVRIVDDDGAELPTGETGEICVGPVDSGPWAGLYRPMLGYWNRPEATAETLRDGLLRTGDLGYVDSNGALYVRDRKSLVIIRGGANVYPAEVERVLQDAPGVSACAVVGVADDRLGERVVAAVQLVDGAALDEEALRAHCLDNLAKYKVPERFVAVGAFERNSMGKINRRTLPALFTQS